MDLKTARQTDEDVVILPGAAVVGDVTLGPGCSIWFNAVLRGDGKPIVLGRGCNVQDCCVLHSEKHATVLGDWVSVGHGAVVHGAVVGDNTIVGMGATLLDFAKIGKNCMVGAGSVVTGKLDIPDGSLVLGNPARVVRPLTEDEITGLKKNAEHYAELKERYR